MQKTLAYLAALFVISVMPILGTQKEKTIQLPGDNAMARLKPGPGVQLVSDKCSTCHSTDYIVRQPRMRAYKWQAEVNKMISVFGAPIDQREAELISRYLSIHYGAGPR